MKLKRLISLISAMTLSLQMVGAMMVNTHAAEYTPIMKYIGGTTESTTWNGRGQSVAIASIGGKMYAYSALMSARAANGSSAGGLVVTDITDQNSPQEVHSYSNITFADTNRDTNSRIVIKDDCLFAANSTSGKIEMYRINEQDGSLSMAATLDNVTQGSLEIVGNYLFVSGRAKESVKVYDISVPYVPSKLTANIPFEVSMGDDTCTEQIQTFSISVEDMGNDVYRIYAINRAKFSGENRIFLSISDISIDSGAYTTQRIYQGQPGNVNLWNNSYDIAIFDSDTIAVIDADQNTESPSLLTLFDVSEPSQPSVKAESQETTGRGSGVAVDANNIFVSTKDGSIEVYQYNADSRTLTKSKRISVGSAVTETIIASGYLTAINWDGIGIYEYKTGISIATDEMEAVNAKISGTVDGWLADDTVTVSINGQSYTPIVSGRREFSVDLGPINAGDINVTAVLSRNGEVIETAEKTVKALSIKNIKMNDDITEVGSVESTVTTARHTSVATYEAGGKKFAYVAFANGSGNKGEAVVTYDITDASTPVELDRRTDIVTKIYNGQIVIKDGYLFAAAVQSDRTNSLVYWQIGSDGKLSETGIKLEEGGRAINNIQLAGNYLFYAKAGTNGSDISIYDVSDIPGGIKKIGNTKSNYGAYALGVEHISDELYRMYYVSRTDLTVDGSKPGDNGWQFTITDMNVSEDGSIDITDRFNGTLGGNFDDLYAVTDIEVIGENKAVVLFSTKSSSKISRVIVDATIPGTPIFSELSTERALSAINIDDNYYAIGSQDQDIKIYRKADNAIIKTLNTATGQIYDLKKFEGNLLVAGESKVKIYSLYTEINIDTTEAIIDEGNVIISGKAVGFKTGDVITVNGQTAEILSDGSFSARITAETGSLLVSAILMRDGTAYIGDMKTINVTDEETDYPYAVTSAIIGDDNKVSISINKTRTYQKAVSAYVAVYDNVSGVLLSAGIIPNVTESISETVTSAECTDSTTQTIKVFVWDDMVPVSEVFIPEIAVVNQNF